MPDVIAETVDLYVPKFAGVVKVNANEEQLYREKFGATTPAEHDAIVADQTVDTSKADKDANAKPEKPEFLTASQKKSAEKAAAYAAAEKAAADKAEADAKAKVDAATKASA